MPKTAEVVGSRFQPRQDHLCACAWGDFLNASELLLGLFLFFNLDIKPLE